MSTLKTTGMIVYGANTIECTSVTYNPGVQSQSDPMDGFAQSAAVNHFQATPTISFECARVKSALNFLGLLANPITSSQIQVYYQTLADEGVRAGLTSHTRLTVAKGILVIDSIRASQGATATLSGTIYPISSNGTTDPVTRIDNASLPTYTPGSSVETLGACSINGTSLNGVTEFSLEFGNEVFSEFSNGLHYPIYSCIMSSTPIINVSSYDVQGLNTLLGQKGLKLSGSTNTNFILTTTVNGITNTTTSVTFTARDGMVAPNQVAGSQGQVITVGATLTLASLREFNALTVTLA